MRVSRWGNSLAVRPPAAMVEALGLHEGDEVALQALGKRSLGVEKVPNANASLIRLRAYRGRLPADFKFDRPETNTRR